jgi:hypothetical protein
MSSLVFLCRFLKIVTSNLRQLGPPKTQAFLAYSTPQCHDKTETEVANFVQETLDLMMIDDR